MQERADCEPLNLPLEMETMTAHLFAGLMLELAILKLVELGVSRLRASTT